MSANYKGDPRVVTEYPAGLKPWDGRFLKSDPQADVVVLTLSPNNRTAEEYAFRLADDAFQVLGRRARDLVSPKRNRWQPSLVPHLSSPWIPYPVLKAAVEAYRAKQTAMIEKIKAHQAETSEQGSV